MQSSTRLTSKLIRSTSTTTTTPQIHHRRTIFSLFKSKSTTPPPTPIVPLLAPNDLFHPLASSPFPEMVAKANRIKSLAYCPSSLEKYGEKLLVKFDCPDCGYPTHSSKERWEEDEEKGRYWPRLREANEDEHDLRSGREMTEFKLPGEQPYEEAVSMGNWDVFLYTRGFPSIDTARSSRHISKLLTYPLSIGSILHESSPYTLRNQRLLPEGLRSLVALRQTLHPPPALAQARLSRPPAPLRIFVLGARAESSLPSNVLQQLSHLFPSISLHLFFIGPEAFIPPPKLSSSGSGEPEDNTRVYGVPSWTRIESECMTITNLKSTYEELHEGLGPFDPYLDVFFSFSPGFGFPSEDNQSIPQLESNWLGSIQKILETKCALFVTGFSPADIERDVVALEGSEAIKGEFDWLLTPGENVFGSQKWEIAEFDPRVAVKTNWGIWGIRGKRYEVKDGEQI